MNKKQIVLVSVGAVVLAGISFWAGQMTAGASGSANRPQMGGQFGVMGTSTLKQGGRQGDSFGGMAVGEILSKDATGITIKLRDGGSRIVFVASSTQILKSTGGSADDLAVGSSVSVTGTSNTDGSVTAISVQIQPGMMASSTQPQPAR